MAEETKKPTTYSLSDTETAYMRMLSDQKINLMMQVYSVNEQMEKLKAECSARLRDVEHAQHLIDGSVATLAASQGFKQAQLSPDLKTLTATVI